MTGAPLKAEDDKYMDFFFQRLHIFEDLENDDSIGHILTWVFFSLACSGCDQYLQYLVRIKLAKLAITPN